ncbi:MAG: 2-oxopent-4-enoate hydratase [Pseudomonadota bacterium]
MNEQLIHELGDTLFRALENRTTIAPLTETHPAITVDDAYRISLRLLENRLAKGEQVIGKKIGVTSQAVMDMLNVHQPDFGFMTDAMRHDGDMPISQLLIQPRAEGELAFLLKKDLVGPGVTMADVIAATEAIVPCFEVVDSRIHDWKIKIQDTVSDNASCGLFTINESAAINPDGFDLSTCVMTVTKNGKEISRGLGSAAMGNPAICVAWLANTLGEFGIKLNAGDVILSGSLVPLEPVQAGDSMTVSVEGIGACSVNFT